LPAAGPRADRALPVAGPRADKLRQGLPAADRRLLLTITEAAIGRIGQTTISGETLRATSPSRSAIDMAADAELKHERFARTKGNPQRRQVP
jgi:hypothetical protein